MLKTKQFQLINLINRILFLYIEKDLIFINNNFKILVKRFSILIKRNSNGSPSKIYGFYAKFSQKFRFSNKFCSLSSKN